MIILYVISGDNLSLCREKKVSHWQYDDKIGVVVPAAVPLLCNMFFESQIFVSYHVAALNGHGMS